MSGVSEVVGERLLPSTPCGSAGLERRQRWSAVVTADGAPFLSPPPPPPLTLHLWRRLDWRFLLPELDPGPVAAAGRLDRELRMALTLLSPHVHQVISAGDWEDARGAMSIVVLVDPSPQELSAAASACRPGGWVYAEVRRSLRSAHGPRTLLGWRRAFSATGLKSVTAHWHAPTIAQSSRIISLDAKGAARGALRQFHRSPYRYVQAALGWLALEVGLLPIAAPEGSVIGCRPELHGGART